MDYLQENGMNGEHQRDKHKCGDKEAIQITVEDLGTDNCSFSLLEEDHLTLRSSAAHSASLMSVSPRPVRKKQLHSLPSLLGQAQASIDTPTTTGQADEDEQEETITLEYGTDHAGASGSLLEQPVISLIPPTPAAGADGDRFFDGNLEESAEPTPDSSRSSGGKNQNVAVNGSEEENTLADTHTGVDIGAKPGARQNYSFAEERDALTNKEEDEEKAPSGFVQSACQVVPLHQHAQKSESPALFLLNKTDILRTCLLATADGKISKVLQSASYLKRLERAQPPNCCSQRPL